MLVFISVCASVSLRAVLAGWWRLSGGSRDFPLQLLLFLAEGFPLIHCDQLKLTAKNVLLFPPEFLHLNSQLVKPVDYTDAISTVLAVCPPELCERRSW